MVNTENKYKKPTKGLYNNTQRYRTQRPVEYRSFVRFLISPSGKMSRDLFVGLRLVMYLISLVVFIGNSFIPQTNTALVYTSRTLLFIVSWITIAMGYKRAHALGISGFYSIVGTSFARPFFEFNKQDNDYITENIKTPLKKLRKFGNFVNKNIWTKLGYLIGFYIIGFIFMVIVGNKSQLMAMLKFTGFFAGINIIQLLLVQVRFFRHIYMQLVKVASFIIYHVILFAVIMAIARMSQLPYCLELYQKAAMSNDMIEKKIEKRTMQKQMQKQTETKKLSTKK